MRIVFQSEDFQQMNPFFLAELRESLEAADRVPVMQGAEQCLLPLLASAGAAPLPVCGLPSWTASPLLLPCL